jgi:hypothetical protein
MKIGSLLCAFVYLRCDDLFLVPSPRLADDAACWLRFDNNDFARSSSLLRDWLNPRPPRFMKYVSIRMPD